MMSWLSNNKIFSLSDFSLNNQTVILRVDYNVPLKAGKVLDNTRIKATLPTIKYLLEQNCKIVLATHIGRPEGKVIPELRTNSLVKELKKMLPNKTIIKLNNCIGPEIKQKIRQGKPKQIFLLENLRFYKEEEQNDLVFAHSLASLGDYYINNAFADAHRKHASIQAITHFLPSAPGLLFELEISQLSKALNPHKPLIWILGGAKLDKLELIESALKKSDYILIGGALAFSFLKAKGYSVGMSKIDSQAVKKLKKIINSRKIILPVDVVTATQPHHKGQICPINQMPLNQMGLDIGPRTIELFKHYLQKANTIVWNGPLGYFESSQFNKGTNTIALFISKLPTTTIIGGGETSQAINKLKLNKLITHISTGGGATLEFLTGKKLPAVKALEENYL